ncbi:hypothetical protein [Kitasatospora sp. NPDC058478]
MTEDRNTNEELLAAIEQHVAVALGSDRGSQAHVEGASLWLR